MSELTEATFTVMAIVQQTLEAKNADYSGDGDCWRAFRMAELAGVDPARAILVRMLDKVSRISTLLDSDPAVAGESLADSALDLVGYAAILAAWIETQREGGDT